ncbi:MAG: DUF59 domain-containing protein [Calditrichaeota bacterium]|jgi:nitrogen fixation protein NifU and related proteins|nr:DUF59 domain-containing protein [Calditrichota bacterium]MBT7788909.1 DUF59 domain-containing protein [Calditrichota bacterium]
MAIKYSQKVIQHFTSPQNVGDLKDPDAVSTEGSAACGDMITYSMKINSETRIVEDVMFKSFGCASNIATASVATVLAKGKSIDDIKALKHADLTDALDGLPAVKLHCSVLAIDGLKSAVRQWEVSQGLIENGHVILNKETVHKFLNGVINPHTGENLIEANMIRRILIEEEEEGHVFIEIRITDEEEMFAPNIDEEIREKLEEIPGVRKVLVQFKHKI